MTLILVEPQGHEGLNRYCNPLHNLEEWKLIDNKVETLSDILAEVKRKPDASDVRDTLITNYCQKCPNSEDCECGDHKCFIWGILGILMEAEK